MIAHDISGESKRSRNSIYNLLSGEGKAQIVKLLKYEREIVNSFPLTPSTREARLAYAKKTKGNPLSEKEQKALDDSELQYLGKLPNGSITKDEKVISVISSYIDVIDIIEEDLKSLESYDNYIGGGNNIIILGKPMSFWNLHPNEFSKSILDSIYVEPHFVVEELIKLLNMIIESLNEVEDQTFLAFERRTGLEVILGDSNYSTAEQNEMIDKLMTVIVPQGSRQREYASQIEKALKLFVKADSQIDLDVYKEVKSILPQYHSQKTKYFVNMLVQYNSPEKKEISNRLNIEQLHAYYRKGVELCYY